ncbi:hypothetical protein SLE2022_083690 [Rubroshorea leprosula]
MCPEVRNLIVLCSPVQFHNLTLKLSTTALTYLLSCCQLPQAKDNMEHGFIKKMGLLEKVKVRGIESEQSRWNTRDSIQYSQ